ncbi:MAG: hypothetical protein L3K01_02595 [Thermoplasmata archaeon]|nr:hypothetical protein [Thermoplasmata archaeon]
MPDFVDRAAIIREIEKVRDSRLVSYITLTDRGNAPMFMVADDAIRPLDHLLDKIGHTPTLDFFLYTRGGSMMAAYAIVKMLRDRCDTLNVIVPFRAHSAGTQIALGADNVAMLRTAQLGPVDPSTTSLFNPLLNPQGPFDPSNRKAISVEDVQAYLNLAKDRLKLTGEGYNLEVFKELTKYYEPLALGNVNRVYGETGVMARELLGLRKTPLGHGGTVDGIVKALTETFTHDFVITRDIAERIGLVVHRPVDREERLLRQLFALYEEDLRMNSPLDAEALLRAGTPAGGAGIPLVPPPKGLRLKLGALESADDSFTWVSEGSIHPPASEYLKTFAATVPQAPVQAILAPGGYPPNPVVRIKTGRWYRASELGGAYD